MPNAQCTLQDAESSKHLAFGIGHSAFNILRAIAIVAVTCLVLRPRPVSSHETLTTTVLFDREIVRVLNKHCVMCHVENGPSFPLASYEETQLRGRKIRAEVIARHMPPWAAVPGYGQFVNENSVTLRESQFVVSWVEGLGPRNAGTVFLNVLDSGLPRPKIVRAEADFGRWQLGTPSLTRQLPAHTLDPPSDPARSTYVARTVVDLGLTAERRIRALEFMPGDRRVVRAAFFTLEETGQWLGGWTPWYGFVSLPAGAAYRVPAGSHVVAEIHYRAAKEPVVDRGTLGVYFAEPASDFGAPRPPSLPAGGSSGRRPLSPSSRRSGGPSPPSSGFAATLSEPSDLVLEARGEVQPGVGAQAFRAQTRLAKDTFALSLRPDLVAGAKSIEVFARRPDGGTEILLFAKDIPMEWPTPYIFKEPVHLGSGTVLSAVAYYANTAAAPQPGGFRLTISRYERQTARLRQ